MKPKLALIINRTSGGGEDAAVVAELLRIFQTSSFEVQMTEAQNGAEVIGAARRAISDDAALIVAGGGDGTVSSVAALLAGTPRLLGIVPLGTLNHFAKDLGLPLVPADAARFILSGSPRTVDVAEVNGQIFVNNSSLGLYPQIVRKRIGQQNRFGWSKWPAFVHAVLSVLHLYHLLRVDAAIDGQVRACHVPFVFIGNNVYTVEGLKLGGRQRLDEGVLSFYAAHQCGRIRLMWLALRAIFGRLRQARDFDAREAREIVISSHRSRLQVSLDGEILMLDTPLYYRIRSNALRVIAPDRTKARPGA